jgi:ankyrin repeat protein
MAMMTGVDVNGQNSDGCTPLHFAAEQGHVDVARLLIDKGMGRYRCDAALAWPSWQGDVHQL